MECAKSFQITVEEEGPCCLLNSANTALASAPISASYATVSDRVFAPMLNADVVVLNATTNAVVGTIVAPGDSPTMGCYSPINDRIYIINLSTAGIIEINPNTMAVTSTIAPPAGVTFLQEPSYDFTNNLIYIRGESATDMLVVSFNPMTGVPVVLISEVKPVAPEQVAFGRRVAHCSTNNRIYVPRLYVDPVGTVFVMVRIFNTAGAFQSDITVPPATFFSSLEQCHWSADTGFVYFLADAAVADAPGVLVIDPATNLVVASIPTTPEFPGTMGFSPECQSVNILAVSGLFMQFDSATHLSICSTNLATASTGAIQMADSTSGKVFVPNLSSSAASVMSPP